jgi:hypothetical protein
MRKLQPYRLILFTTLQLAALFFLAWVVQQILPVLVNQLFMGMDQWNPVSIAFCWMIQVGLLVLLLSVRNFILPFILSWMRVQPFLPLKICWVLLALAGLWGYWLLIRLIVDSGSRIDFLMIGQCFLLLVLLYGFTEMAAPMGSFRAFRLLFLHQTNDRHNTISLSSQDVSKAYVNTSISPAPDSPEARSKTRHLGYPGWVWPFVWMLFFMLLNWVGCFGV